VSLLGDDGETSSLFALLEDAFEAFEAFELPPTPTYQNRYAKKHMAV